MVYNCTLGMRGNVIVRYEDKKEREGETSILGCAGIIYA